MKRLIPIIISAILLSFEAWASNTEGTLRFDLRTFDFGTLAEDGGTRSHTFAFTNTSSEPIVILKVNTSCGCTTAQYTRHPIGPNGRGEVTVVFDPMNQPGGFSRRLSVYTSDGGVTNLTITGSVTPRVRSISERYTIDFGQGLMVDANAHAFGYVEHGAVVRSTFGVYNNSEREVSLLLIPSQESGALDIHYPHTIAPKAEAEIDFGYMLGEKCALYGTLHDVLAVEVNGRRAHLQLIISAIAIDSRKKMADNEPPKIQLSENFIKFGALNTTSRTSVHRIKVYNAGLSTLQIRKIESERGIAEGSIDRCSIGSDREATLSVKLHTKGLMPGAVTDRLRIVTNDPHSPVRTIRVTAIIER
ncbi:MAG: DUF1573 domain-containing protein [Alistipes sp.]|nr:DUF1573 domain-containing protein [Alistipes sp.]